MHEQMDFPVWDNTKPEKSLMLIYEWAVKKAHERIKWYEDNSKKRKTLSQLLRIIIICSIAVGGLCPLIDATGIFLSNRPDSFTLGKLGYVFIAIAAAIMGFDKYFGLSTGWMRYIVTQLSLERSLQGFQYDWAFLLAQQKEGQTKSNEPLLQRVKDFSLEVENQVKQETDAWVMEFQSNLAELQKVLKTEIEAKKFGSIKVKVSNAMDFERVSIRLNDSPIKDLVGVTERLIEGVPPKRYEIMAVGVKDGIEYKESKIIEVQPNSMSSVEMTLQPKSTKATAE